jgi:hypothetical protein
VGGYHYHSSIIIWQHVHVCVCVLSVWWCSNKLEVMILASCLLYLFYYCTHSVSEHTFNYIWAIASTEVVCERNKGILVAWTMKKSNWLYMHMTVCGKRNTISFFSHMKYWHHVSIWHYCSGKWMPLCDCQGQKYNNVLYWDWLYKWIDVYLPTQSECFASVCDAGCDCVVLGWKSWKHKILSYVLIVTFSPIFMIRQWSDFWIIPC